MAGLAQAGAAMGTAIMPGIGTAIGGLAGALGDTFMGGGGSAASAGGPQTAHTGVYGSGLDGSNWNVNFSGTQTATSSADKSGPMGDTIPGVSQYGGIPSPASLVGGLGDTLGAVPWPLWAALGAVVLWKISKSKK